MGRRGPHPHFHLFATQNPPMLYGGRKVLSRAFRNRFVELQVDDIPHEELHAILEERYRLPARPCPPCFSAKKQV